MEDKCVVCGAVIPEGRHICPVCERRATSPCKDCESRHLHCHANCERYSAFKSSYGALQENIREQKAGSSEYSQYIHEKKSRSWARQRIDYNRKNGAKGKKS